MKDRILNLGILAHVDSGKTSLTERLLYDHGVIPQLGSVDEGNTTTDSGELERERGITIRSAVVSFDVDDLAVNLVDTPGHPDFIAEVERALSVLDGVILVISAVEGVQAQTRVIMQSLSKIRMPTIIFINKIDRTGARTDNLLQEIRRKLTAKFLPINDVDNAGSPEARIVRDATVEKVFNLNYIDVLIENKDEFLTRFLNDTSIPYQELHQYLISRTHEGAIFPLYFGSALKGIGIDTLSRGIKEFLPSTSIVLDDERTPVGTVFAIERSVGGQKIAYIRLFEGALRERQTISYVQQASNGQLKRYDETISGIEILAFGKPKSGGNRNNQTNSTRKIATAGDIVKVRGLSAVRVGAQIGSRDGSYVAQHFPPPVLETIVHARNSSVKGKLYSALMSMSDEDPLIQARVTAGGDMSIKLYGEVQKQVIRERLCREYGIDPDFSETRAIYFERPAGMGKAFFEYDKINVHDNIFPISIALRVERNEFGAGNRFVYETKLGQMPSGFYQTIEESAINIITQGLYGWEVTDCVISLTDVDFERPLAVAAHFRNLTSILVMRALDAAGTIVYEPYVSFNLEIPLDLLGTVTGYLINTGAEIDQSTQNSASSWQITGNLPARLVQEVRRKIPSITRGEGVLTSTPGTDQIVRGEYPVKEREDGDPLDFENYLKHLEKNKRL